MASRIQVARNSLSRDFLLDDKSESKKREFGEYVSTPVPPDPHQSHVQLLAGQHAGGVLREMPDDPVNTLRFSCLLGRGTWGWGQGANALSPFPWVPTHSPGPG